MIVLLLTALIVIVIEAIRSDPASAPTGNEFEATSGLALDSPSAHLYIYADEAK